MIYVQQTNRSRMVSRGFRLWKDVGASAFDWEWIIVTFRAILGLPRGYRSAVLRAAGLCNPLLESSATHCVAAYHGLKSRAVPQGQNSQEFTDSYFQHSKKKNIYPDKRKKSFFSKYSGIGPNCVLRHPNENVHHHENCHSVLFWK